MANALGASWRRAALFGAALAAPLAVTDQPIELKLPIECEIGRSCFIQNYVDHDASPNARDYQCGTLTYDSHDGTDFRLPTLVAQRAGVNVLAVADGKVLRMRDGAGHAIPSQEPSLAKLTLADFDLLAPHLAAVDLPLHTVFQLSVKSSPSI